MTPAGAAGRMLGWRCAVCSATVDIATPHPFACPRRRRADPWHVLHPFVGGAPVEDLDDDNPMVRYAPRAAWWEFAASHGMTESARIALATEVAAGFAITPLRPHDLVLSAGELPVPVWVKDETGNVGGSHKARHLVGILLHLLAAEALGVAGAGTGTRRRRLAIASCGNAAIAAATLAGPVGWPLDVFVPTWASDAVLTELERLGAAVTVCERRDGDAPGDPAVLRFREAVGAGALPFSVQGPENALCLDTGRTIGWEIADAVGRSDGPDRLDRFAVQAGGGALAACAGWGLGATVRLDTVQADGCAPLARAWWRAHDRGLDQGGWAGHWAELMTPWEDPHSAADGIVDDETYDWLGDFDVMARSGGTPLVAPEEAIVAAHGIARTTGIPVSTTGSAGLAGLLVNAGRPGPGERVAVVFSGAER